ncbi:UNVERIFIED_CONTAM: Serine carboxypeptidase-like 17 [Sesamum radiatum]|uniref:Carboxypeptidase n=1 Tax=Sesamum radiatum TaxID=300843 RepID=A0AAW2THQ1_SESRA
MIMESVSMKVVVFVLIILCCSNTVLAQHVVETLPGLPDKLPNKLETGYIGVGENEGAQLFYFFFESESNPEEDPLVLWMTGGPGCSGLSTILLEMGTIIIDYANCKGGPTALKLNEYGWTKAANILFIDQPAGTGYSYSKTLESSLTNDTVSARQTYDFIRKWLINHPKYLENPLYIFGESYAGIMLARVNCHGNYVAVDPNNHLCLNALEKINQEDNVWLAHTWANDKFVQKALNVREGPIIPWTRCNMSLSRSKPGPSGIIPYIKNVASTIGYHKKFTNKSVRVLIFRYTEQYAQGDYDLTYATIKEVRRTGLRSVEVKNYTFGCSSCLIDCIKQSYSFARRLFRLVIYESSRLVFTADLSMGGTSSGLLGGDAAAAAESTIDESSGPSHVTAFHSSQRWQLHFNSSKQLNKLVSLFTLPSTSGLRTFNAVEIVAVKTAALLS